MPSEKQILQYCRLCLAKEQVNVAIFDEHSDIRQIFLKISACLPVKVSRDDNLPKKICDGCSYKLDVTYQFWNSAASAEKQLIEWLNEAGAASTLFDKNSHSLSSDTIINLKQEVVELSENQDHDTLASEIEESSESYILQQQQQLPYQQVDFPFQDGYVEEEVSHPATSTSSDAGGRPKRKRRAAALKALPPQLDSEDEDDMLAGKIAKTEEQSDSGEDPEPTTFIGLPSTSTDDQPGPSGIGKSNTEAPYTDPLKLFVKPIRIYEEASLQNGIWVCTVCSQNFATNADLKEHIYSEVLDVFVCCKCGSKFADEKTFRLHIRDHKKQLINFTIKPSNCTVTSTGKLIDHRVNNVFICKYCDAQFSDRIGFYNHYVSHTFGSSSRTASKIKDLKVHVYFSEAKKLGSHIEVLYAGVRYRCSKCQEGFISASANVKHSLNCLGRKKYCDMCSMSYDTHLKLYTHYQANHAAFKDMCSYCFTTFDRKINLVYHILNSHLRYSHYCCDCNQAFNTWTKYSNHIEAHNEK